MADFTLARTNEDASGPMSAPERRKRYREEDLVLALQEHENGAKIKHLCGKFNIPDRTMRRKIDNKKNGVVEKRPGPAPVLGREAEEDIRDWALAMQREGYPVDREGLIAKAQEVYAVMYGKTRAAGTVGRGWCDRFLCRYPLLTPRSAQVIKRARNDITDSAVSAFFARCARAVVENGAGSARIFNVDETSFEQNAKSRKVIARRGSRNVWSRSVDTSFHLTIVACGSAEGYMLPPLFIVPGKRLNRDVLDASNILGARITTADAGFMTTAIMRD